MQIALEQSLAGAAESRWSPRRTLVFVALSSSLLWIGLLAAVRAIA